MKQNKTKQKKNGKKSTESGLEDLFLDVILKLISYEFDNRTLVVLLMV